MAIAMDRPNVLLICTDHWPGSLLAAAGHPAILTPTLDQLARNGVRYPNAYSECPVCVPARRTLMTSLLPHRHGLLSNGAAPMPDVPTLAQAFQNAGYQTTAVGKLHVHPQRQRLGFGEVLLDEEGRGHEGCRMDDYELFLADHGHPGQRFAGGMNNNQYLWRPWHLDEALHVTNWAAQQMSRQIIRRDPLRPGFFYLSFSHPHPPLAPLQAYLELYRDMDVPEPHVGQWISRDVDRLPPALGAQVQRAIDTGREVPVAHVQAIRRAFYALCTHIDHQIRVVLGTLRQEGLINDTIICFTADHGDMLGNHRLWAKQVMYDDSARVPMILVGTRELAEGGTVGPGLTDDRLVGLSDVMPTLLRLAGVDVPPHCQGLPMTGSDRRDIVYGACGGADRAGQGLVTRMVRDPRFKLIYYPAGNVVQVFDMVEDPNELHDLADSPDHREIRAALLEQLLQRLDGEEQNWQRDGQLVGVSAGAVGPGADRGLSGQRGVQLPPPPLVGS